MPEPVRLPAVAGRFYPLDSATLARDLDAYLRVEEPPAPQAKDAVACMVPHAGYMYSGHVAGEVYRRLAPCDSCIVLGPNHFGRGRAALALISRGSWVTPLGKVKIDEDLCKLLVQGCPQVEEDPEAHAGEHSLEVQIPFLQRVFRSFRLVPVAVGAGRYDVLESLGHGVAHAVRNAGKSVLIVASTDLNHYEPDEPTRIKDRKAIDRILALDPQGLYEVIAREDISMCGFGPTIAMLVAARELGAQRAELVKYATSADTSGDRSAVVGYAGIIVSV
jgi:AmmeMemoRadiSam system protein B